MSCLTESALEARLAGRLDARERDAQDEHLGRCSFCREWLAVVAVSKCAREDDDLARGVARAAPEPGAKIGRYITGRELGRGAMGVVLEASDPELDRKIAIKLLHPDRARLTGRRLVREARALAKLAHPNVVTVYDVGIVDGRLFVAMELVAGTTLRGWLGQRRSLGEILDVFIQAALGLAAAHDAGFVHRDFKPENVVVAADGRVKVTDFGLVHSPIRDDPGSALDGSESRALGTLEEEIGGTLDAMTGSRHLVGTPLYMAPEQHRAEPVDPRCDQFAFCVALWEALCAKRPFPGRTFSVLSDNVVSGRLDESGARGLSRHLRHSLVRGLATDPEQRWSSMHVLIDRLRRDTPEARRRSRRLAAGVLGAGMALSGAYLLGGTPNVDCTRAEASLATTWNAEVANEVLATNTPAARFAHDHLDAWATAWTRERIDACEATHVRSEQTVDTLETRVRCLERARAGFVETIAIATELDARDEAAEAADALPDPSRCGDGVSVAPSRAAPASPEQTNAEDLVERARSQAAAGRIAEAEAMFLAAAAAAELADDDAIRGASWLGLGELAEERGFFRHARDLLARAMAASTRAGDPRLTLEATIALADVLGQLFELDAADLLATQADASLDRGAAEPNHRVALLLVRSRIARSRGQLHAATALAEAADEVARRIGDPLLQLRTLGSLGVSSAREGQIEEAVEVAARVTAEYARLLGEDHRRTVSAMTTEAYARLTNGEIDEAERLLLRALARVPDDSASAATIHLHLGRVAEGRGRHRASLERQKVAIEIGERRFGRTHPEIASFRNDMGATLAYLGRKQEAREQFEEVLRIREIALGPNHPRTAGALQNLANIAIEFGEIDVGLTHLERARVISELTLPEAHNEHAEVLYALANAHRAAGNLDTAEHYVRRALAMQAKNGGANSPKTGFLKMSLAQLLLVEARPGSSAATEAEALAAEAERLLDDRVRPSVLTNAALLRARATKLAGRTEEARAHAERARQILESSEAGERDEVQGRIEAFLREL